MLYIFDWDGTISDSAAKIVRCMQVAAERAGTEPQTEAAIRNIIGLGMPEALQALYPSLDEDTKERIRYEYSRFFKEEDATPSPFFSGVMETMEHLREQGYLLGVATGKSRNGLDRVLARLGMSHFFHVSRCADETASKPHPQMLLEILDELKLPAEEAVMIGDTEYGMAMARSIAMPRIAVSYGAHAIERLQTWEPVLCVDHFPDILGWRFRSLAPAARHSDQNATGSD